MLKRTVSVVTAVVVMMGGLSADGFGYKDMKVVGKVSNSVYPMGYTQPPYADIVESTPSYDSTIVLAEPTKRTFRVDEAIQFRLQLSRESNVYVWTVGRDGRGYMILPNEFDENTLFDANREYRFPEASTSYEFQSDRAGVEHIYILATSKPIPRAKLEEIFDKEVGQYPMANAQDIEDFTTRDINVIAKNSHFDYDIVYLGVRVVD